MLQSVILNPQAESTVIWLHGLGADGHDFVPVVELLQLSHIRFVLPHAPYRPVSLNNGYEMRAWYDIFSLQPDSAQDSAGINTMESEICRLIDDEIVRGVPAHRIVLAGFSQGGAMALHTAARYAQPLAGVLALSTYLPLRSKLPQEKHPANQSTPIWMAHGDLDTVIHLSTAEIGRDALRAAGYAVEWHRYDMPHSVCEAEIAEIRIFLQQVLPKRPTA